MFTINRDVKPKIIRLDNSYPKATAANKMSNVGLNWTCHLVDFSTLCPRN